MSALLLWLQAAPTLLTILTFGVALVLLVWRGAEISAVELFGWGWLSGAGVGSMLLGLLSLLLAGEWLHLAMLLSTVALLLCAWKKRLRCPRITLWPLPLTTGQAWSLLLLLPALGWIFYACTYAPLLTDGLFNWEMKARLAFENGGALPLAYFQDATRKASHPYYPLLVPLTQLWLYLGVGLPHQVVAKFIFPLFFGAGWALLFAAVCRLTRNFHAAFSSCLLILGVPLMCVHAYSLFYGFADYIMAIYVLAAVCTIIGPAPAAAGGFQPRLGILMSACLPWAKSEGAMAVAILATMMLSYRGIKYWRAAALFAAGGVTVWLLWKGVLLKVQVVENPVFSSPSVTSFAAAPDRFPVVAAYFLQEWTALLRWGLVWYLFPVVLAAGLRTKMAREIKFAGSVVLLMATTYLLPYLFTRLNLQDHLATSANRLVLHYAWVAILCYGLLLGSCLEQTRKHGSGVDLTRH